MLLTNTSKHTVTEKNIALFTSLLRFDFIDQNVRTKLPKKKDCRGRLRQLGTTV